MNRRAFLLGLTLSMALDSSAVLARESTQRSLLHDLWELGDQIVSNDPELARCLIKSSEPITSISQQLSFCSKNQEVSLFNGWVLPTGLLELAVRVRLEMPA